MTAPPTAPAPPTLLLVCTIDAVRYAVAARDVQEIVRAAAVTPLPGVPPVILGLLDLRGTPVPVLDARRRFGHPPRPLAPDEQFVVATGAGGRAVALRVDRAVSLVEVAPERVEDPRRHLASVAHVAGVVSLDEGLLLIHDVAAFLSGAEADALAEALAHGPPLERAPAERAPIDG